MKAQVNVWGWCVVDSANWPGAYAPHKVIAKVQAVFDTKEEAEAHLAMMKLMPKFLHKDWIIVNVGITFFEIDDQGVAGPEPVTGEEATNA